MDVIEGIQTRHSIRAFKDTPIPSGRLKIPPFRKKPCTRS